MDHAKPELEEASHRNKKVKVADDASNGKKNKTGAATSVPGSKISESVTPPSDSPSPSSASADKIENAEQETKSVDRLEKSRPMGTWSQWSKRPYGRMRTCQLPELDNGLDYNLQVSVSPVPSCGDVEYTVVQCGYTSRIPLSKLPNAIGATDGLWGPHQIADNADDDLSVLDEIGFSIPNSAFLFKGEADLDHLLSFEHCGCFNYRSLFKVVLYEYTDDEADGVVRILKLTFDTESG